MEHFEHIFDLLSFTLSAGRKSDSAVDFSQRRNTNIQKENKHIPENQTQNDGVLCECVPLLQWLIPPHTAPESPPVNQKNTVS